MITVNFMPFSSLNFPRTRGDRKKEEAGQKEEGMAGRADRAKRMRRDGEEEAEEAGKRK